MIEFAGLPGASALGTAWQAVKKSRDLRQAWKATMRAGHLSQVQGYGSFAVQKSDPVADWLARKIVA